MWPRCPVHLKGSDTPIQYRGHQQPAADCCTELDVAVGGIGSSPVKGSVHTLTGTAVSVTFDPRTAPQLRLGAVANVHFTSPHLGSGLVVKSLVHHWRDLEDRYLLGFKFLSEDTSLDNLPNDLCERLRHCREQPIQPVINLPLHATATFESSDRTITGEVRFISPIFLTMDLPAGSTTPCVTTPETARISLCLPGSLKQLELVGKICRRQISSNGEHFRIGVEFDATRTTHFKTKQELLNTYVLARQREEFWHALSSVSGLF